MNELFQLESGHIGSQTALDALRTKNHCRILVMSDSHGNYRLLIKIIKQYGPSCHAFIFCGDGAGDIAELLEQAHTDDEIKQAIPPVIAFVRGNGDPETYPVSFDIGKHNPAYQFEMKGTLFFPEEQTLTANKTRFFITHGHNQAVYFGHQQLGMATIYNNCTHGIYGHTHISYQENFPKCKLINPGSISRPRGGDQAGFAIITVEKKFTDTAFIKISDSRSDTPSFKVM